MNHAYYSANIPANLFSLGYMQRCGATYQPDPLRPLTHVIIKCSPSGPTLTDAALSTTNLLPINSQNLQLNVLHNPSLYYEPTALNALNQSYQL